MPVKLSLIAAVAENGVIGKNGDIPWKIASELGYFKKTVLHKPIILGRKSFESIPGSLPGRGVIVLTRNPAYAPPAGVSTAASLDAALTLARNLAARDGFTEVFVGGGEAIYNATLHMADCLYLTEVHMKPEGDTRFPAFSRNEWVETKRKFHAAQPGEDADYTVTVLERK